MKRRISEDEELQEVKEFSGEEEEEEQAAAAAEATGSSSSKKKKKNRRRAVGGGGGSRGRGGGGAMKGIEKANIIAGYNSNNYNKLLKNMYIFVFRSRR